MALAMAADPQRQAALLDLVSGLVEEDAGHEAILMAVRSLCSAAGRQAGAAAPAD